MERQSAWKSIHCSLQCQTQTLKTISVALIPHVSTKIATPLDFTSQELNQEYGWNYLKKMEHGIQDHIQTVRKTNLYTNSHVPH